MTQPYAYVDSPYRCVYDGKRLVAEYGQHHDDGELVETHSCLECGRVWNTRDRALLLPEVHDPAPWMTYEQIAERRAQFVDRPEFLRNQPGLRAIVEEWEVAHGR